MPIVASMPVLALPNSRRSGLRENTSASPPYQASDTSGSIATTAAQNRAAACAGTMTEKMLPWKAIDFGFVKLTRYALRKAAAPVIAAPFAAGSGFPAPSSRTPAIVGKSGGFVHEAALTVRGADVRAHGGSAQPRCGLRDTADRRRRSRHQKRLPGTPLNGPARSPVIQPP
jgi:hypothetical protein